MKVHSQDGPDPPSTPSLSPSFPSSSGGASLIASPTLVSRKKVRTTGVALPPRKSVLMERARGCFHPHAFPTSFHISPPRGSQSLHLTKS